MSEAQKKLEGLNTALAEAARALEAAEARAEKSEKIQRYISRQGRVFGSSLEYDAAVATVAAAGGIPEGLMAFLRAGGLRPFSDPDDAATAEDYDDARRAHELLQGAIALLRRELAAAEKTSVVAAAGDRVRGLRNLFRRDKNLNARGENGEE